jgi:hypothetical protein
MTRLLLISSLFFASSCSGQHTEGQRTYQETEFLTPKKVFDFIGNPTNEFEVNDEKIPVHLFSGKNYLDLEIETFFFSNNSWKLNDKFRISGQNASSNITFDSIGNPTEKKIPGSGKITVRYDNKSRPISIIWVSDKGNIGKELRYHYVDSIGQVSIENIGYKGAIGGKIVEKFANGNLISKRNIKNDFEEFRNYTYNSKGLLDSYISTKSDGSLRFEEKYRYKYNSNGDWIELVILSKPFFRTDYESTFKVVRNFIVRGKAM